MVVDLNNAVECTVCHETYNKILPGTNVCGDCQVAMAIVMNWKMVLWYRWGIYQ